MLFSFSGMSTSIFEGKEAEPLCTHRPALGWSQAIMPVPLHPPTLVQYRPMPTTRSLRRLHNRPKPPPQYHIHPAPSTRDSYCRVHPCLVYSLRHSWLRSVAVRVSHRWPLDAVPAIWTSWYVEYATICTWAESKRPTTPTYFADSTSNT